ncbi:hypothetical protein [uncultured Clostridium sp.]|uniref:hypothetical protein n=1 Tax=uncultured Clostridium sp. TaxID=59620 RepID=UPI0025EADBB2|nr:hypothetical protein [uncultured Clostridium sp.]
MKKPIIDDARYTKIALFMEPLIKAIGIKREAKVRMLIVLIGNNRFKYKITIVKAVNTALKVSSLAFKVQPPPNIY